MEPLKCDFCGGNLIIDDSREFANCEFCGTKYMASTIREKIQEIRGTVSVEGTIETTVGDKEKERLINNSKTLIELSKFGEARKSLEIIANQFSNDYSAWFLLFQNSINAIKAGQAPKYFKYTFEPLEVHTIPISDDDALETAIALCSSSQKQKIIEYFNSLINVYGNSLHTNSYVEVIDYNGNIVKYRTIDTFTKWVLFSSSRTAEIIKLNSFYAFRERLSKEYLKRVCSGECAPFVFKDNNTSFTGFILPISNNRYKKSEISVTHLVSYLKKNTGLICQNKDTNEDMIGTRKNGANYIQYYCSRIYSISIWAKFLFLMVRDEYVNDMILIQLPNGFYIEELFRANRLCQYCGGTFKGTFSKKCTKCGKPKNY